MPPETQDEEPVRSAINQAYQESLNEIAKTLFDQLMLAHDEASIAAAKAASKMGVERSLIVKNVCIETLETIVCESKKV